MSATTTEFSTDGLSNQGQFRSKVPPSESLPGPKHQPGKLVGNDAAPEFTMEQHPPGTAPKDRSFEASGDNIDPDTNITDANATLGGATSADVDTGYGKPIQGQTGNEKRHDGQHGRKHEKAGLERVGANVDADSEEYDPNTKSPPLAEEQSPVSAEELAKEFD